MTAPIRLNPSTLPDAEAIGYSQISIVDPGRLAFVSGQVAVSRGGGQVPASVGEQTDMVVTNLSEALKALRSTTHDIVQMRIYALDMSPTAVGTVMAKLGDFLNGAKPSLTVVGVSALASPEFLLEIELVVRLSSAA